MARKKTKKTASSQIVLFKEPLFSVADFVDDLQEELPWVFEVWVVQVSRDLSAVRLDVSVAECDNLDRLKDVTVAVLGDIFGNLKSLNADVYVEPGPTDNLVICMGPEVDESEMVDVEEMSRKIGKKMERYPGGIYEEEELPRLVGVENILFDIPLDSRLWLSFVVDGCDRNSAESIAEKVGVYFPGSQVSVVDWDDGSVCVEVCRKEAVIDVEAVPVTDSSTPERSRVRT